MFSQLLIMDLYTEILVTFGIFLFLLMVSRVLKNVNEMRTREERIFDKAMRFGKVNEVAFKS